MYGSDDVDNTNTAKHHHWCPTARPIDPDQHTTPHCTTPHHTTPGPATALQADSILYDPKRVNEQGEPTQEVARTCRQTARQTRTAAIQVDTPTFVDRGQQRGGGRAPRGSTLTRLSSWYFKRSLLYISVQRMDANRSNTAHACIFQLPHADSSDTPPKHNASSSVLTNSLVAQDEVGVGR